MVKADNGCLVKQTAIKLFPSIYKGNKLKYDKVAELDAKENGISPRWGNGGSKRIVEIKALSTPDPAEKGLALQVSNPALITLIHCARKWCKPL